MRSELQSNKEEERSIKRKSEKQIKEDSDSEQEERTFFKSKKRPKNKEEEDDGLDNLSCSAGSMNAFELSGDEAECTVFKMKKAFKNN